MEVKQHAIRQSFVRIGQTLKHLPQDKQVFWFLLAFFCYIDGVYTIIDMATAYGTALGLETTGLLLALLVTQIVADCRLTRPISPGRKITPSSALLRSFNFTEPDSKTTSAILSSSDTLTSKRVPSTFTSTSSVTT